MRVWLALLLGLLLLAAPAQADEAADAAFRDGMAAYAAKDYHRAMTVWLPLAEAGHAEAQYRVGWLHGEGEGVAKDESIAATWYRKAADQGHALGQALLGNWLWHHWQNDEEYAEAGRMFRLSAKQGEVWGLYGAGL